MHKALTTHCKGSCSGNLYSSNEISAYQILKYKTEMKNLVTILHLHPSACMKQTFHVHKKCIMQNFMPALYSIILKPESEANLLRFKQLILYVTDSNNRDN